MMVIRVQVRQQSLVLSTWQPQKTSSDSIDHAREICLVRLPIRIGDLQQHRAHVRFLHPPKEFASVRQELSPADYAPYS
jgi:hypothetical protein